MEEPFFSSVKKLYRSRPALSPCWSDFYIDGIVHKELVRPGQTVNKEFYRDVLRRLREDTRRKRPEKARTNDWVLHHDNVRRHTAYIVQGFLVKN
jgi:hypothetical protein